MRTLALLAALAVVGPLSAADPVVIVLPAKASAGSAVVTLGQIAKLHGGDEKLRARLAAVDVADRGKKDAAVRVTQKQVEVRLKLAGFTADDAIVGGADAVSVSVAKKAVASDEVVAATKKALREQFAKPEDVLLEHAQAIAVRLPEVATDDTVTITAKPRYLPVKLGRVEMETTITVNGEKPLSFPVYLDAKPSKPDPLLVTRNQKVTLIVRSGGLTLEASGEAMQDGREGQAIKVLNPASKKVVTGKVTAAGVVDVDIGGTP